MKNYKFIDPNRIASSLVCWTGASTFIPKSWLYRLTPQDPQLFLWKVIYDTSTYWTHCCFWCCYQVLKVANYDGESEVSDVPWALAKPSNKSNSRINMRRNVNPKYRVDELNEPPARLPGIRSLLPLPGGDLLTGGTDLRIRRWDPKRFIWIFDIYIYIYIFGSCKAVQSGWLVYLGKIAALNVITVFVVPTWEQQELIFMKLGPVRECKLYRYFKCILILPFMYQCSCSEWSSFCPFFTSRPPF